MLDRLPLEIFYIILSYVHLRDSCSLSETSTQLAYVIDRDWFVSRITEEVKRRGYYAAR